MKPSPTRDIFQRLSYFSGFSGSSNESQVTIFESFGSCWVADSVLFETSTSRLHFSGSTYIPASNELGFSVFSVFKVLLCLEVSDPNGPEFSSAVPGI